MNNYQTLELIGVLLLIGVQVYIFYITYNRIQTFKNIFPASDSFFISKPFISGKKLKLHPKELLDNLAKHIKESEPKLLKKAVYDEEGNILIPEKYEEDNRISIDLISYNKVGEKGNNITKKIIDSLNIYLIRNKGVASDFHLIKDVVERNCDVIEEDINQTISLPLYIGLLGTFFGIVIGLFQISGVDFASQSADNSTAIDEAISLLLGGVKIAMIASFTGLFLTIYATGYLFRGSKAIIEDYKNDFYTFIQIELLPLLNQNINSTLFSLQNNLHKFNEEFKTNVVQLSSVMGKNHDALIAQEKILTTLDGMDITAFAKANVTVLRELQLSTDKFSEFNQYLNQMNEMVLNSKMFADKVNEMISRTDNFNELGKHILESFGQNKILIEFLQQHYNSLDESHQLITNSVGRVNNTLDESLDSLRIFTQDKIIEVQKLVNKEMDLLENQYPEKWKKLDNLSHLQSLNNNLNDIKISNASQMGSLTNEIKEMNKKLLLATNQLEQIKNSSSSQITSKISKAFNGMFKKSNTINEK